MTEFEIEWDIPDPGADIELGSMYAMSTFPTGLTAECQQKSQIEIRKKH